MEKEKKNYNMEALQVYFNEELNPSEFAQKLSEMMMDYALAVSEEHLETYKDNLREVMCFLCALKKVRI